MPPRLNPRSTILLLHLRLTKSGSDSGDVALYSNVLDELITVNNHGIAYEIIPGITALSGALSIYRRAADGKRVFGWCAGINLLCRHNYPG